MKKTLLIVTAYLLLTACSKNPFVSKEVIDEIEKKANPTIGNVAVIYNNDVYYYADFLKPSIQITHSPSEIKKQVRINHAGTKIAYLNSAGTPVIIDLSGNTLATLTQYTSVDKIDWTFDDNTLYILTGNQLYFYGATPSIPTITYVGVFETVDLQNVALSKNNDLAYIFRYFSFSDGYRTKVIFKRNGSNTEVSMELEGYSSFDFKTLCFPEGDELMVGFDPYNEPDVVSRIYIYKGGNSYVSSKFDNSQNYTTPVYKSSVICMISGYQNSSGYYLASNRYGYKDNIYYSSVNNDTNPIYTDWK